MIPAVGYLIGATQPSFNFWVIVVLSILTILYAVMRPKFRRKKDPLAKGPRFDSLAQQRSAERTMTELLVELEEMARRMTAQLDTRSAKLELLIQDAEEKIAQLQTMLESPPPPASALGLTPPTPPTRQEEMRGPDPRHQEIHRLADEGRSAAQIAQALHRPRGEIELILALRGDLRRAGAADSA